MYHNAMLYYFSGTGNTKALAETAGEVLARAGATVMLRDVVADSNYTPSGLTGIFFPVYCFGAPRIIVEFVRALAVGGGSAAVVIANAAGMAGSAHGAVARVLSRKGYQVRLAAWVPMPSNYIVGREAVADSEAAQIILRGKAKVTELFSTLDRAPNSFPRHNAFAPQALAHRMFLFGTRSVHRFYRATDKCTGCGACVSMCPKQCISPNNDARPCWKAGCEHCMRCVNFCPEAAIEFGSATMGKKRYNYWQREKP